MSVLTVVNDPVDIVEISVLEDTSHTFKGQLKDIDDANLLLSSLDTITLTLFVPKTGTVVNSRDNQNIKNANDVVIDANGAITWTIRPEDTVIITPAETIEVHRALFQFTDTLGNNGKKRVDLVVHNIAKVP